MLHLLPVWSDVELTRGNGCRTLPLKSSNGAAMTTASVVLTTSAAVCACLLFSGCSSGSGSTTPPPTTSITLSVNSPSPSASLNSRPTADEAAVDAYRGMWSDVAEAARTSNYRSPLLARHATGSALTQLMRSLYLDRKQGLVSRGAPVLSPRVTSEDLASSPSRVVIDDCADSRHWLHYKTSGQLADNTPGGRRHITATVIGFNGSWKVAAFEVRDLGSC